MVDDRLRSDGRYNHITAVAVFGQYSTNITILTKMYNITSIIPWNNYEFMTCISSREKLNLT